MLKTIRTIHSASKNAIKCVFMVPFLLSAISMVQTADAQQLSPQKMAAVMAVINNLLLAEREGPIPLPPGMPIEVAIGDLLDGPFTVTDQQQIFGQFPLQEEGIEFCFDVSASQTISPGDFVVEVNGTMVAATEGKDNCYQIPEFQQRLINYIVIRVVNPGLILTVTRVGLEPSNLVHLGLPRATRGTWDERAVRKVLKIFAFGGHARDGQIQDWADMDALSAIQEMLTFEEHNLKLSPLTEGETYSDSASIGGTLFEWLNFIGSAGSNIPIPLDNRESLGLDGSNFDDGFNRMITVRGLNPFRQRIGFWETNYHLATNFDAGVSRRQMARYYDLIMQGHEAGLPYHEIMGIAAKSAAVAEQYGHDRNQWRFDPNLDEYILRGNDDFGREIHQLFYGIFGVDDPDHEDVTIRETSKMLTDMPILNVDNDPDDDVVVNFGTNYHHLAPLTISGQSISGANASEKIDNLMPVSIEHPESLQNLPVMIIQVLADDNLSEGGRNLLRSSWASMGVGQKNFLEFIHAYAISNLLHSSQHIKYLTTHERALYLANKNNIDNIEAYFGGANYSGRAGRSVGGVISEDNAGDFFRPIHNVFGGQTGLEAADSALVFENNYDRQTESESNNARSIVVCDTCDLGGSWEKSWPKVLPDRGGKYYVKDIAPWLWNHAVGSMDNYTELERAHLYSILGAARIELGDNDDGDRSHDFNLLVCMIADYQVTENTTNVPIIDILDNDDGSWDDYCNRYDDGGGYQPHEVAALNGALTGSDIENDMVIQNVLAELGEQELRFSEVQGFENGDDVRKHARERVNSALGFIFTTPFVFAEARQ